MCGNLLSAGRWQIGTRSAHTYAATTLLSKDHARHRKTHEDLTVSRHRKLRASMLGQLVGPAGRFQAPPAATDMCIQSLFFSPARIRPEAVASSLSLSLSLLEESSIPLFLLVCCLVRLRACGPPALSSAISRRRSSLSFVPPQCCVNLRRPANPRPSLRADGVRPVRGDAWLTTGLPGASEILQPQPQIPDIPATSRSPR